MAVTYLFQFLDKSALGFTAIMGLREDLGMVVTDFSWANRIYYFGYLVSSYPAGVFMIKLPVAKFISSVAAWALSGILTAVCFNTAGLLANRFFLGVAEAAVAPGPSIIISMWYKRSGQPLRHGAWFLGNTVTGIFGGLCFTLKGALLTIPLQAVFIVFGAITITWGAILFKLLPDLPSKSWFLTEDERLKAVVQVKET
ncbi:unnamed protein product [Clonostachys chloroleuca]|uniref:Major facilitator superfamily (MFS) profile domain-containing protein n=1 Tax=Clonostachys chloroleuca TaxID=1926264 RepID=A0AA35VKG4_9HYPO|nr:unnamed protein product [Clonostachys chloroleuca]